jgi:uncharacterized protein (TIGR03435 family)
MKRFFLIVLLAACTVFGQTPPAFEVVSIKPSDPLANGTQIGVSPGGMFTAKNAPVKALIQQAYEVRDFQIAGGPGWLDTARYDIVGKGDGSGPSEDDLRKMTSEQRNDFKAQLLMRLQALLADRFQLKIHRETKELQVYALTVGKGGSKIQTAKEDGSPGGSLTTRRGDGGKTDVSGTKVPIGSLIKLLSNLVGRTVLDQTGLKGDYDFKMTFAPDLAATETDGPSIFTALQEQLGLKLEAQKGPVEVIFIDNVQKASEN